MADDVVVTRKRKKEASCRCGSLTHLRTTNQNCPLYQKRFKPFLGPVVYLPVIIPDVVHTRKATVKCGLDKVL